MSTAPTLDLEQIIQIALRADAAAERIRTVPRPQELDAADWAIIDQAAYDLAQAIRVLRQRADQTGSERDWLIQWAARYIARSPGHTAEAAEYVRRIVGNAD